MACTICNVATKLVDADLGHLICSVDCQMVHYERIGAIADWPIYGTLWLRLQMTRNKKTHAYMAQHHVLVVARSILLSEPVSEQELGKWASIFPPDFHEKWTNLLRDHVQRELGYVADTTRNGTFYLDAKAIIIFLDSIQHRLAFRGKRRNTRVASVLETPWIRHMNLMHEWIYEYTQKGAQMAENLNVAFSQAKDLGSVMDTFFWK